MFSDKLKELRKLKGLTQEELADILHISRSAVAKWEQGKGVPNKESIKDIVEFFGVSKEELFSVEDTLEVIDVIEQEHQEEIVILETKHKKSIKKSYLIFGLVISLILGVSIPTIIRNNKFISNSFYTNSYLNKMGLKDLEPIEFDDFKRVGRDTIYGNVNSSDKITDYTNYILKEITI